MKDENQILYHGRWVPKANFCAFVYSKNERRLAKSYDEYSAMISSGIWFDEPNQKNNEKVVSMKRGKECHNQAKT